MCTDVKWWMVFNVHLYLISIYMYSEKICKVDAVLVPQSPSTTGIYLRTWTSHLIKGEPAVPGFIRLALGFHRFSVFLLSFRTLPTGYGSIPINTIFRGMNIHLPAILMFTRGTRFWHTANCKMANLQMMKSDLAINMGDFPVKWCYQRIQNPPKHAQSLSVQWLPAEWQNGTSKVAVFSTVSTEEKHGLVDYGPMGFWCLSNNCNGDIWIRVAYIYICIYIYIYQ